MKEYKNNIMDKAQYKSMKLAKKAKRRKKK